MFFYDYCQRFAHRRSLGLVTEIFQPTTKLRRNRNHQPSEMPKLRLCAVTSSNVEEDFIASIFSIFIHILTVFVKNS